jgi:hypothetical protein
MLPSDTIDHGSDRAVRLDLGAFIVGAAPAPPTSNDAFAETRRSPWPVGSHLLQPGAYGGGVAAVLEMSLLPGGSKAAARCGAACLRPTVVSVKTIKENTMTTTLLDYRAMMAELHIDDLLREAAAARKVQAARAARRQRGG